jgi:hypothetical protein
MERILEPVDGQVDDSAHASRLCRCNASQALGGFILCERIQQKHGLSALEGMGQARRGL